MEALHADNSALSDVGLVRKGSTRTDTKHTPPVDAYVKNIENGTEVKFQFQRMLSYDGLLTLLTALNIALTLLYVMRI